MAINWSVTNLTVSNKGDTNKEIINNIIFLLWLNRLNIKERAIYLMMIPL